MRVKQQWSAGATMVRYGEVILLQKLVKQSCQLKEEISLVTAYALEVRMARVSWSDTVDRLNSRVSNRDCVFGVSLDSPNSFNSLGEQLGPCVWEITGVHIVKHK